MTWFGLFLLFGGLGLIAADLFRVVGDRRPPPD